MEDRDAPADDAIFAAKVHQESCLFELFRCIIRIDKQVVIKRAPQSSFCLGILQWVELIAHLIAPCIVINCWSGNISVLHDFERDNVVGTS